MNNMGFFNPFGSSGSGGGGGGGEITVDTQVMEGSTNPVQNGAIYDFVNSSVATNTANFIGTFDSFSDLSAYSGTITNNDYAFVVNDYALLDEQPTDWAANYTSYFTKSTVAPTWVANKYYSKQDSTYTLTTSQPSSWSTNYTNYYTKYNQNQYRPVVGLDSYSAVTGGSAPTFAVNTYYVGSTISYNRYKYTTETNEWLFEYTLNNSSFTAAEWETIQSGLTANDKTNYNNHLTNTNNPHSVTKAQVGLGNVDNTSDADKPVSTATQTALSGKQDTLTFDGTYDASTNKAATVSTVTDAINDLDVPSVGGSGKYISAISETNGKISPTVETMDTVPTSGSTKAVTSGGVQAPLAEVVDAGAKNLVQIMQDSLSIYNIVFSVNKLEGTITITGSTSSAYKAFRFFGDPDNTGWSYGIPIPKGTYVLSGLPSGASQTGVRYILGITTSQSDARTTTQIYDGDYAFTIGNDTTRIDLAAYVPAGQDLSTPFVFKPMICSKSQWDVSHQFEPYALSNPVITPALIEQVDNGAKNLLDYDVLGSNSSSVGTSVVVNGVRFTMNSDKSVTVNRESSSSQDAYVWFRKSDGSARYVTDFCDDEHVFSGAAGASASTYRLYINNINGSNTYKYFSNGEIIGIPQSTPNAAGISIAAGYSPSNLVIKPMICTKTAWDVSHAYEPYGKTNAELTKHDAAQDAEIAWNVNNGVKNLFDINATPVKYHITSTLTDGVLSGTSNGDWASYNVPVNLPTGDYIFSAVISNFSRASDAGEGTIRIRITNSVSGGTTIGTTNITGNGAISIPFSWSGGQFYVQYSFNFSSTGSYVNTFTASNSMIRPASITDSTFQPYALSNPVITPALIKQVDNVAKNKLKNSAITQTVGEVVYTVNSDGTVSAYTTATTTASRTLTITLPDDNCYVNAGDLITGNPDTALDVAMQYGIGSSGNIANYTPSEEYHVITVSGYIRYCLISIRSGVSISQSSPLVFKPMVCSAADYAISKSYVPYALSNPVLTPAAIKAVDEGAKNICNWSASTSTISDVTFTINSDKTVSTSGTATARAQKALYFTVPSTLKAGRYVLSGCPSGGAQSGTTLYCLYIWDNTAIARVCSNDTGDGIEFDWTPDSSHTYSITVDVRSGTNASGFIFKPMICTAEDYAVSPTFQPYALPNPTLTPAAIKAVDEGAKNLSAVNSVTNQQNYIDIDVNLKAGKYIIFAGSISTTSSNTSIRIGVYKSPNNLLYTYIDVGSNKYSEFEISDTADVVRIFATNSVSVSSGESLTFSDLMLCTAQDWAVSQKFVPYCPTNRELYETKATMRNVYGFGTVIPSNSNLNDYKTPGVYRIESSSIAATISNLPTGAAAGRLEVKGLNAADRYLQIYYSGDVIFQRRWTGTVWGTWYKFEGTAVT